ncbi:MAG: TIM barrel protein [Fimbriimonadaceae bacterium]|nr:TIM barrel protein [Fimbriimonadaceae bacterium]
MDSNVTRRQALAWGAAAVVSATASKVSAVTPPAEKPGAGRLNQSVCKWCYSMDLDKLAGHAAKLGLKSVELLGEADWPTVAKHGLVCAVANGPTSIGTGWNRIENHDRFVKESERLLPLVKAAGIPNMIVFSGNRAGLPDDEGLANCAKGLKRITPLAEELGVTVIMELLNSKVDHHDYQCDKTPWGVELVKRVGSPRFKLLYDIYHMQIMEGDVIRTIEQNHEHIAHYHTAGNPGRNEIDATQELNYRRVAQAIADTGFKGYFAHEFIPKRDPVKSLGEAYETCLV